MVLLRRLQKVKQDLLPLLYPFPDIDSLLRIQITSEFTQLNKENFVSYWISSTSWQFMMRISNVKARKLITTYLCRIGRGIIPPRTFSYYNNVAREYSLSIWNLNNLVRVIAQEFTSLEKLKKSHLVLETILISFAVSQF